ncbi:MAG: fibronectin type III domain-containing protein [Lachnospiraceae bacterium]|nr:fibronectin type III domain-containing protein [Lachnospiraceae bacterium]
MKACIKKLLCLGMLMLAFVILMPTQTEAITNLKQKTAKKTSATITWKKSAGEASWQVEYVMSTKNWVSAKTMDLSEGKLKTTGKKTIKSTMLSKTKYTCKGLQAGRIYKVKVHAFNAQGEKIKSATKTIKIETLPDKVECTAAYWPEVLENPDSLAFAGMVHFVTQDSADGYQVRVMDMEGKTLANETYKYKKSSTINHKSGNYIQYQSGNQGTYTFFAQKGKEPTYKVKIRAYQIRNGKKVYGAWTTAYGLRQPIVQYRVLDDGSVQLRWNKNSSVTGYAVYVSDEKKTFTVKSTRKAFNKSKVVTCSGNMTTVTLKKGFFKPGKTNYILVTAEKNVGGKIYSSYCWTHYVFKVDF